MAGTYVEDELSLGYVEALDVKPRRFRVKIHTGDMVEVTAAQLLSFSRFNQACAEQVGRVFSPPGYWTTADTRPVADRWRNEVIQAQKRAGGPDD